MNDEQAVREIFAPARAVEAQEADVQAVLTRLGTSNRSGSRRIAGRPVAWVATLMLLLGGLLAVPPVRATLGEAADSLGGAFAGYFEDETSEDGPGRPTIPSDTPPAWLTQDGRTGQRLIASEAGYELYVVQEPSGDFGFALDDSIGLSASAESWQRKFAKHDVVILGPIADPSFSEIPLFGVNSPTVVEVRVDYDDGTSATFDAREGGFVAMLRIADEPVGLTGLDGDGSEIEAHDLTSVSYLD